MKIAILSGGEFIKTQILPYDKLICADKGYEYAKTLSLTPDIILGDFDSLGYTPNNAEIFPKDKNFSDTELAVKKAIELGATDIDIYFSLGGRLDHELFNINLLKYAKNEGVNAKIISGNTVVRLISGKGSYKVKSGNYVSFVPFSSEAHIIKSKGLKYPLDNITAKIGETLTLSNVAISDEVFVDIESGELLLICFL